jgi:hypothetical protein
MLRNDTRNISVVICDIDTVMTKPQRTLVSVVCLLAASRYHGHHDRNQMKEQSRMDMYRTCINFNKNKILEGLFKKSSPGTLEY